jgi:hypothetical protein
MVTLSSYDEAIAGLPSVAPQDAYESNADYQRRLTQLSTANKALVLGPIIPDDKGDGLSYNPDRQLLTVYRSAFGAGRVNFGAVFHDGFAGGNDNFASAIGFRLSAKVLSEETYFASNAFGAKVNVTRITRNVRTVWERAGKNGEDPFLGMRQGVIAQLHMTPTTARDLIERGNTALLIVPKPPYTASGTSTLEPEFQRPIENVDRISILIADVQCGFLLNSSGQVIQAFASK